MTDHIETLREFNAWRRGAEIAMPSPAKAGLAIDALIAEVEALRKIEGLLVVLQDIVKQDPVDLALDPQWPQRMARFALMEVCGMVKK